MKELPIPPVAHTDSKSCELARVWAIHGEQHVSLDVSVWPSPASWGLLLADLANHISQAYAKSHGLDAPETLERIREAFDAEMESPTTSTLDDR